MKLTLTLFLVVLATALSANGQTKNDKNAGDSKAIQELRKLVQTWDNAFVAGDAATLDRLLADEFSFVGGENKAQNLAALKSRSAESTVESAVSADVEVQIYGNTAIVTGLDTISGKNKGEPYTTRWLYMDVWIKRSGRWQCVKTYSSLADSK